MAIRHPQGDEIAARYGIGPGRLDRLVREFDGASAADVAAGLVCRPDGSPDRLALALLREQGSGPLAGVLSPALGCPPQHLAAALRGCLDQAMAGGLELTGAEATALVVRREGVRTAFAYAGTSELALCDSLARLPDVRLVNGHGDSASAFMAAGASLLAPAAGLAVLHAARGLTHAAGAIADARRNEVGLVALVGLPSTRSARFLPPHGEPDLILRIGSFAAWSLELGPVPSTAAARQDYARRFVADLGSAFARSRTPPAGPSLIGLPQDVAEAAWLPLAALDTPAAAARSQAPAPAPAPAELDQAAALLASAQRTVVLIDDYLLRHARARPALAGFAGQAAALVLQVRYRRGAMLFERLDARDVPSFLGWYDPARPAHRDLLAAADLLVTVEDRNLYRRVTGPLPACRTLAITSDAAKVAKNEYLRPGDLVLEGHPVAILRELTQRLAAGPGRLRRAAAGPTGTAPADAMIPDAAGRERTDSPAGLLRAGIVAALADAARSVPSPVIVDDSQMFGGLVSGHYDQLPAGTRVFGDHCGFVGSGISYATGLALSDPSVRVFCLLGDQAFTNGLQGLVAAGQERAPVVYLVCNNGQSVSLLTQAAAGHPEWFDEGRHPHLRNPPAFEYTQAARSLGVAAWQVGLDLHHAQPAREQGLARLREALRAALDCGGPALIELRLPSEAELWDGIWLGRGFDEPTGPAASEPPGGPTESQAEYRDRP